MCVCVVCVSVRACAFAWECTCVCVLVYVCVYVCVCVCLCVYVCDCATLVCKDCILVIMRNVKNYTEKVVLHDLDLVFVAKKFQMIISQKWKELVQRC